MSCSTVGRVYSEASQLPPGGRLLQSNKPSLHYWNRTEVRLSLIYLLYFFQPTAAKVCSKIICCCCCLIHNNPTKNKQRSIHWGNIFNVCVEADLQISQALQGRRRRRTLSSETGDERGRASHWGWWERMEVNRMWCRRRRGGRVGVNNEWKGGAFTRSVFLTQLIRALSHGEAWPLHRKLIHTPRGRHYRASPTLSFAQHTSNRAQIAFWGPNASWFMAGHHCTGANNGANRPDRKGTKKHLCRC